MFFNLSTRKRETLLILLLAIGPVSFTGCQTVRPGTATGGAFGTLAGALTGASIGATEGKAGEGALIGALAGGTVGSFAGNAIDRQVERDRLDYQQEQAARRSAVVDVNEVIRMSQSGLGSDIIASQIQSQGVIQRPTIDDLILLKNQGIDEGVIQAFQNAPVAGNIRRNTNPQAIYYEQSPIYYESCEPFPLQYGGFYRRRPCGPGARISVGF